MEPPQSSDSLISIERVQETTWALLDGEITPDQMTWLEDALRSSEQARSIYLQCVQCHAELIAHFAQTATPATARPVTISPVLGFLHGGILPLDLQSMEGAQS
jgi:hypothetical protein